MSGSRPRPDVELLGALPRLQKDPAFPTASRQAHYLARLRSLGVRTAVWMFEAETEPAVAALRAAHPFRLVPVVPNMQAYLRDASDHGVVGAAVQRFRRLPPVAQARLALHHATRGLRVLRRDFATGLLILVDMELARLRREAPAGVLLNASVTDLVLALDQPRLLRDFVRLAERTYGIEAGLGTYNYGTLAARLGAYGLRPSLVAAPFNPRGYLMNPSRAACEAAAKSAGSGLLATHVEVDGLVPLPAAFEYVAGVGIARALVDLALPVDPDPTTA
jgi:hypothetical protein